jgi:hypothetical protein
VRRRWSLLILTALPALLLLGLLSTPSMAQAAGPRSCGGQVCNMYFQNKTTIGTQLWLGTSGGNAILFTADGAQTQRWDVFQITGSSDFVIYSAGTSNVITRGAGCMTSIMYCAYVKAQVGSGSHTEKEQKWLEVQTNPYIFESECSTDRCLDNFHGDESSGSQVILFPCSSSDTAQQWAAKATQ